MIIEISTLYIIFLFLTGMFVIISENSLYSIFFMILNVICISLILFKFNNEYFALVFLIIYTGAVAILFLFVIMMINLKQHQNYNEKWNYNFCDFCFKLLILDTIFYYIKKPYYINNIIFENSFYYQNYNETLNAQPIENIIGEIIFLYYAPALILVAIILLISLIGCIYLTIVARNHN